VLGRAVDVVVVDSSADRVAEANQESLPAEVRHIRADPATATLNGKVGNVLAGVRLALHERVVVADDDVRYDEASLRRIASLLESEVVVRPQNYFDPMPWHAWWDSGRTLVARVLGGDWPGTLAFRRSALLEAGGYRGDVLFENYELVSVLTRRAAQREVVALDLFVARRPPAARQFWSQRVRQAYDEWARPSRLVVQLAWFPITAVLALRRPRFLTAAVAAPALLAEAGRRRAGGGSVFPWWCSLAGPVWVTERSVAVWLAVVARLRGGVRYRGDRILVAASKHHST
jgi:hypothetical protein